MPLSPVRTADRHHQQHHQAPGGLFVWGTDRRYWSEAAAQSPVGGQHRAQRLRRRPIRQRPAPGDGGPHPDRCEITDNGSASIWSAPADHDTIFPVCRRSPAPSPARYTVPRQKCREWGSCRRADSSRRVVSFNSVAIGLKNPMLINFSPRPEGVWTQRRRDAKQECSSFAVTSLAMQTERNIMRAKAGMLIMSQMFTGAGHRASHLTAAGTGFVQTRPRVPTIIDTPLRFCR